MKRRYEGRSWKRITDVRPTARARNGNRTNRRTSLCRRMSLASDRATSWTAARSAWSARPVQSVEGRAQHTNASSKCRV